RTLGAIFGDIQTREVIERNGRRRERSPRDDNAAEIEISWTAAHRAADVAHQQRVDGEERDRVASAGRVMKPAPRDLQIPAGIVADEPVPERTRRTEEGVALIGVIGKYEVRHERDHGRDDAESDRIEGDPERRGGEAEPLLPSAVSHSSYRV